MKYSIVQVKKKDRTLHPIKIRITDRTPTYYSTGILLLERQWNKEKRQVVNHPQKDLLNAKIRSDFNKVESIILDLQLKGAFTKKHLREHLTGVVSEDFYPYIENYINLTAKPASLGLYKTEVRRLRSFAPDLTFNDVNVDFLRKYLKHLESTIVANNTVLKAWKNFRKFIRAAYKDKKMDHFPFLDFDHQPRYIQTERTFLLWSEVKEMESLLDKPLSKEMRTALLFFLLSCYTGMRLKDWYRYDKTMVKGDRFIGTASKNKKFISFKITPSLQRIIDQIGDDKLTLDKKQLRAYIKALGAMAGIDKEITPHVARHSFATRCLSKKINKRIIAGWMGVSEKTVEIYAHLIATDGDEDIAIAFGD